LKIKMPKFRWKPDPSDSLLIIGGLTICGGVGMIYRPAAVILLGVMIIILAFSVIKPNKGG
jgi:hypothetical protein